MADTPEDRPSLEMPTFSLRRRKGRTTGPDEPVEPAEAIRPEASREAERLAPPGVSTAPVAATAPTRVITAPRAGEQPAADPGPAPARRAPRAALPPLPGLPAAAVTGAVVGALAVLLTWLSTSACDAVRGTSSCGGGPGFLILVAVLVVLAYAGALLLRAFGVSDAASTSVLAVGVTAVLVMLFLLDSIYDGAMVIAIPIVAVIAYSGSWWITQAVVEDD